MRTPTLTNDEKKAAEAAFQKQPFNPTWSEAARKVYDGLSAVLRKTQLAPDENVVERDDGWGSGVWPDGRTLLRLTSSGQRSSS
jgi:hypothetical protein